jgi:hypothetical protein
MDFNIMSADEVNSLFKDVPDESTDGNVDQTKDDSTVEVKADNLFDNNEDNDDDEPEETDDNTNDDNNNQDDSDDEDETSLNSVLDKLGKIDHAKKESKSKKDNDNDDDTDDTDDSDDDDTNSSDKSKFYKSIAKALKEDGVVDVDDETLENIKDSNDFVNNIINKKINDGIDDVTKRVYDALTAGVQVPVIKQYENTINILKTIENADIEDEGEDGENVRKKLIFQQYINRGFSDEKAKKEVEKSFNAGTDIDDAKDALSDNLEFFQNQYNNLIEQSRKDNENRMAQKRQELDTLKKSIMSDSDEWKDFNVNDTLKQKIYDNITRPAYKGQNGETYTEIQKYERENRIGFLKNVSLCYTLTNGFTDFSGLSKAKVRKEVSKGMRELESALNSTSRTSSGALKFITNTNDDPESSSKGWDIDV